MPTERNHMWVSFRSFEQFGEHASLQVDGLLEVWTNLYRTRGGGIRIMQNAKCVFFSAPHWQTLGVEGWLK